MNVYTSIFIILLIIFRLELFISRDIILNFYIINIIQIIQIIYYLFRFTSITRLVCTPLRRSLRWTLLLLIIRVLGRLPSTCLLIYLLLETTILSWMESILVVLKILFIGIGFLGCYKIDAFNGILALNYQRNCYFGYYFSIILMILLLLYLVILCIFGLQNLINPNYGPLDFQISP